MNIFKINWFDTFHEDKYVIAASMSEAIEIFQENNCVSINDKLTIEEIPSLKHIIPISRKTNA